MKIFIPNNSRQSLGGGFTFRRNFIKGMKGKAEIVDSLKEADVLFISGITMVDKGVIFEAKEQGKKIILRIDGIPRNSRNKRRVSERIPEFSKYVDAVIFQSEWSEDYVGWWIKDRGVDIDEKKHIVYNGVDTDIFNEEDLELCHGRENRYLYVQFNRDENKRKPEAFYTFHKAFKENKSLELWLAGKFSNEVVQKDFDFFAGEDVRFFGVIQDPKQLAFLMRNCKYFLFPAFMDACPNTLLEAINCGCEPIGINEVGGSKEVLKLKGRTIYDMAEEYKKIIENIL